MMNQVEEVLKKTYSCSNKELKGDLYKRPSIGPVYRMLALLIGVFFMVSLLSVGVFAEGIPGNPLINPLGNLEAYNSVEFTEKEDLVDAQEFSYRNTDDKYVYLKLWGDYWYFDVPISPEFIETDNPLTELITYLEGIEANFIACSREEIVATVPGQDGELWWVFAKYPTDRYDLWVIKEDFLVPGRQLEVYPLQEGQLYRFATYNEGNKFLSYRVKIPVGTIFIRASGNFVKGDYESQINYERELSGIKSSIYYLDDIPQQKGRVFWEVQCMEDTTDEISFSLEETLNLPQIEMNNKMGALQIKGSSFGEVWLEPAFQMDISFPNYSWDDLHGIANADGEIVFWLPPGYWDIKVEPLNYANVMNCTANLLPVSSGKITKVELPPSLTTALSNPPELLRSIDMGGMEISRLEEKGQEASICFTLFDKAAEQLTPTVENTEVLEAGIPASVLDVQPVRTPPDIVLLLDSSGSMKGQMEQTVAAARKFIESLPDDTNIQVFDFDTEPRLLEGNNKVSVLVSLDKVKANGATALYDSVIAGLNLLDGRNRPTLLLFTDGVDANYDDSGPGSKAAIDQVITAVQETDIPIYTIGFGPNHDNSTLTRLADLSGGKYYPAADPMALDSVFAAIKENLGNTYQALYERPTVAGISDIPVVYIVIDSSGSMDLSPENEGCGYRMQKVKNLLRDFILDLPEHCLVQIMDFNYDPYLTQMLTPYKEQLIQGLGELNAGGGTCIMESTEAAYLSMRPIPSSNKILLYITDAALNVEVPEKYTELLTGIKDNNIKSIWIGLGMEEEEEIFASTSEKAGGRYVLSEDPVVLEKTFDEVLEEIKETPVNPDKISVRLTITQLDEYNQILSYTDSKFVEFTKPASSDQTRIPEGINYLIKDFDVGDGDCESAGVYDSPINGQIRELPIAVKGENQAVEIEVKKAAFFKRFNDLELPYGYQFLALDMKFSNILAAQEVITYPDGGNHPSSWINGGAAAGGKKTIQVPQYLIPDLSSHLFLNCNNGNMYPASPVTWLSETPLMNPGEFDLTVLAEAAAEGVSIFVVPDQAMEQLSLHFYDTAYGHIVIPLVGDVDIEELELEVLPQGEPVRLSEAFSIVPAAVKDIEEIAGIRAADWDSVFRVVEAELTSNVQALLDINPEQVFSLSISTKKGDYFVPLNPITENLPMGFVRKTMIAPGSFNKVRLAFQVPYALAEEECSLYVNMKKDDVIIPLEKTIDGEGFVDEINTCEEISNDISSYKGEGIELIVNQILSCSEVMNLYNNWLVADVTLLDYSDGFETALYDGLKLVREKTEEGQESQSPYIYVESTGLGSFGDHSEVSDILIPAEVSGDLLLGISNETVIIDGTTRRGFVLFEIPETGLEYNWSLQSALFPEMNIPVQIAVEDEEGNKVFSISENNIEEEMLVASTFYNEAMREYNEKLDQALQEAVVRYQALQAAGNNITLKKRIDLNAERMSDPAPVPQLSLSGVVELSQISSIENFRVTMEGIRWLPSKDNIWQYRYAPEAVLTQGWGTENDLAILAERILKQLGYITEKQTVVVTEEGYHSLRELGQVASLEERYLPALGYRDEDGNNCLFVLPFMKDISELRGLVRLPETTGDVYPEPKNINLIVSLRVESTDQGVNTRFSDMSSALAGEGEELQYQEIQVFSEYLPLDTLSLDAIDLGYTVVGREYGDLITVVVETSTDKVIGQEHVDTGLYRITGAKIELALPDDHVSHQVFLEEEDSIDGIFHTLAINLPDISSNAMSELQNTADNTYNKVEQPDLVSALRWYTRNIINRFIFGQSEFENDLAEKLDLNIGRTRNPRCLIVTVKKSTGGNEGASMENGIETSIDLMRAENETHYGEKTAREAFNILSGIFASKLEAEVLPGKHQGLFEIWQQLPEETDFVWIFPDNKGEALSIMEQCNWPERIRNLIAETEDVIFTPTIPALIDGEERWAWLKINPYDYRTIAVLDTGERGAAVEYSIGISEDTAGQFFVASFIGLDISIWSVACFSLKLDNYEQILDQAEKMARGLGQRLFSVDLVDEDIEGDGDGAGNVKASMGIGGGKPSLSYYGITVDYNPGLWRGTFKFSKGLIDGFSKGYETAIDLYFGAAREGNSSSGDNSQGNHGGRGNGDEGGPGGE